MSFDIQTLTKSISSLEEARFKWEDNFIVFRTCSYTYDKNEHAIFAEISKEEKYEFIVKLNQAIKPLFIELNNKQKQKLLELLND